MPKTVKILRGLFILLLAVLFAATGCASSKKNPYSSKKKQASHVNASQLGRNKYYFSTNYQKKLTKNYKK
jgi:hypothetical protein